MSIYKEQVAPLIGEHLCMSLRRRFGSGVFFHQFKFDEHGVAIEVVDTHNKPRGVQIGPYSHLKEEGFNYKRYVKISTGRRIEDVVHGVDDGTSHNPSCLDIIRR